MPRLPGGAILLPLTMPKFISYFLPPVAPDAEALAREADDRLFKTIPLDPNHVLRMHFPKTRSTSYNLRPRSHEFKLPLKDYRNYVPRLLFKDMYWVVFLCFTVLACA